MSCYWLTCCIYEQPDMLSVILSCFPFFLSLTYFCLLIVGAEGYCCTWSHSMTHTHPVGLLWTRDRPAAEASSCTRHTTHNRLTSLPPAGLKPQPRQASGRRPTLSTAWPPGLVTSDDKVMEYPKYPKYLMTKSTVIQSLRTYTSLINSPAKNNKPFQNFTFLYHFRNSLHVASVLSQLIRCTHLHHFSAFPCVVRHRKTSDHEIQMHVVIVRGLERCITHFQTPLPHSALITMQASAWERCGGCIYQEPRRNLAQRSIPASLRPWSFGVQPRSQTRSFQLVH